jgi:hypothetical protein
VRGDLKDFLRGVKQRLVVKILKNKESVSTTFGFVASQVLNWAQSAGVDLNAYRIPIAILVALVMQSVLEELESRSDRKGSNVS